MVFGLTMSILSLKSTLFSGPPPSLKDARPEPHGTGGAGHDQ